MHLPPDATFACVGLSHSAEYQILKTSLLQKNQVSWYSLNAITSSSSDELWQGDITLDRAATESVSFNQALLVKLKQLASPISNLSVTDSDSGLDLTVGPWKTNDIEGSEALIPCFYFTLKFQRNPDFCKLNHLPG
ncbi:hypothetical protein BY996DRAFT_6474802 [Phakopsora pachyrhizi]|nr:hypothetical protein BY996DRAFT_6474802 [Phakopsora pachyrhizi]